MSTVEPRHLEYVFKWPDGHRVVVPITLDAQDEVAGTMMDEEWVALLTCQCPNCPLKPQEHPTCPVARRVAPILIQFADAASYEEVEVTVNTPQRSYVAQTSLQQGLSSMLGVVMASSGCPVLDPLKPMARFHLPFATYEETAYRALSMFLVAQHLRVQEGQPADWELKGLAAMYEEIQSVNAAFAKRLRCFITNDANANALAILDCFAAMTSMELESRQILPESLVSMFAPLVNKDR